MQRDRLKEIMQTIGGPRGEVDAETMRLSAKLAGMKIPEEFAMNSPYSKKYGTKFDDGSLSPRSLKWRPFHSAMEFAKIQPESQHQFLQRHEERLAIASAKKSAAEAAAALQAAEAEAREAAEAAAKVVRPVDTIPDNVLRRAHQLVRTRLTNQDNELRFAFQRVDKDRSGEITRAEFAEVVQGLELGLPETAIARMLDLADYDGDGVVSFAEFCRLVESDDIIEMKNSIQASTNVRDAGKVHAKHVLKKDPQMIKKIPGTQTTEREVKQALFMIRDHLLQKFDRLDTAFKRIDEDRSGYLSRNEMRFCVCMLNLEGLGKEVVELIIDLVDMDGDGKIRHKEFVQILGQSTDGYDVPIDFEALGRRHLQRMQAKQEKQKQKQ